jgi:hypothetical protein
MDVVNRFQEAAVTEEQMFERERAQGMSLEDHVFKHIFASLFKNNNPSQIRGLAMDWAKHGDWDTLAEYIDAGGIITRDVREFLMAVLRRKLPKPDNRAPKLKTRIVKDGRAMFALLKYAEGTQKTKAREWAAEVWDVDFSTIERNWREFVSDERGVTIEVPTPEEVFRRQSLRSREDIANQRYLTGTTALSEHFLP